MANIQSLSNLVLSGDGPGTVQYRFQPIVLAMAGHKAEAINWIKNEYLTESAAVKNLQIGQALLATSLFQ